MSNRVSQDQIDMLLDYLMGHPNLATGVGLGLRSKETVQRLWDTLASNLNALGSGSTKTGDRWKRYWNDLKHKAKTRASSRTKDLKNTGGGPPNPMGYLSETDQKVLAIIGPEAVFGDVEHRVPLFRPPTQEAVVQAVEEVVEAVEEVVMIEDYQSPVSRSQNETQGSYVEEEPAVVNFDSPSTRGQTGTRAEPAVVIFDSPSTRGQTGTAGDAENRYSARRLLPTQINSPVSRSRRGIGRTKVAKTSGNQVKADSAWVVELERKRAETEEKLANAALMMAEASLIQAEAARTQTEVARILAESVSTLFKKYIEDKK